MGYDHSELRRLLEENPKAQVWKSKNEGWIRLTPGIQPTCDVRFKYAVVFSEYSHLWQAYLDGKLEIRCPYSDAFKLWEGDNHPEFTLPLDRYRIKQEVDASIADSANSKQIGGDHYQTQIQPWDFIEANGLTFLEGSIVKYVARHRRKNGLQDLEKAKHFLEKLIEVEKGKTE